jgi:hypothetical protein
MQTLLAQYNTYVEAFNVFQSELFKKMTQTCRYFNCLSARALCISEAVAYGQF